VLQLREWSQRFFTTLAKRTTGARGGTNPIYNLLPDMLSVLIHEPDLTEAQFMQIMRVRESWQLLLSARTARHALL
jgi:hypothetical protein